MAGNLQYEVLDEASNRPLIAAGEGRKHCSSLMVLRVEQTLHNTYIFHLSGKCFPHKYCFGYRKEPPVNERNRQCCSQCPIN